MRIGQGFDLHRMKEGRPLMLGGIEIESDKGEDAHSDGDVLIHALIDALLGSKALGDIGTYFPPSDMKYKNMDSKLLLKETLKLSKFEIINIDCNIILQRPKLGPHILKIRESLASLLNIDVSNISVKAKTAEHILGELGSGDAIAAEVTLLIN
ncbi:MAG: 2-C-methyl-D-erythritol 2,4-cyclodiphosphate synthase [Spirochaetales bacterium]|uniref:2-C-methyl-D-erythritol 2,4-cyclodiphosphate synthase n=1 Tax=Bullifex sp. TaxID=2815808 RepID=UPI002A4E7C49|nr:2-C-methyl-D-erythritol 2,4-cyclodiphosphate synthase [Bullifex sp.]MDD5973036.1 2-C-methyl-D-erythritol 2,4-cyclodiphosphate synthase [Spirochaetales bacterium]MDD7271847.1 2-C-methyl-D-erythritol 2,4-cyclodiphosphate synthase [Spirochaetales bacterium]MDY4066965.1 2-C-methyl-D-erythritol 2,4-cyclodiphosphate synthase [Bullifex sp.]